MAVGRRPRAPQSHNRNGMTDPSLKWTDKGESELGRDAASVIAAARRWLVCLPALSAAAALTRNKLRKAGQTMMSLTDLDSRAAVPLLPIARLSQSLVTKILLINRQTDR